MVDYILINSLLAVKLPEYNFHSFIMLEPDYRKCLSDDTISVLVCNHYVIQYSTHTHTSSYHASFHAFFSMPINRQRSAFLAWLFVGFNESSRIFHSWTPNEVIFSCGFIIQKNISFSAHSLKFSWPHQETYNQPLFIYLSSTQNKIENAHC